MFEVKFDFTVPVSLQFGGKKRSEIDADLCIKWFLIGMGATFAILGWLRYIRFVNF
jgi:hypothetical protein